MSAEAPEASSVRVRITEAAALLLQRGGAQAVTTRAVAHAAGVPTPTIFRIFGDKDGLMDAVAEHVMSSYVAAAAGAAPGGSGDAMDDLRAAWRSHVDFGLTNPDIYVLISAPGRLARSPATATGAGVLRACVRRLAESGLLVVPESRAVEMIHAAGTGVVLALLQQPAEGRDVSLADAVLDAVVRAISTATPSAPASDLAPLAIAFRTATPHLPGLTVGERQLLVEWLDRAIEEIPAGPAPTTR